MAKVWLKRLLKAAAIAFVVYALYQLVMGLAVPVGAVTCTDEFNRSWECKSMAADWEAPKFVVDFQIRCWTTLARAAEIEQTLNEILKDDLATITIELKMEEK